MGRFPVRKALSVLPLVALLAGVPPGALADTRTPPATTPPGDDADGRDHADNAERDGHVHDADRAGHDPDHDDADDHDGHHHATGPFVKLLQQRLAALHLYTPQTGVYDTGTGNAIDAYRRLIGLSDSQTLDPAVVTHVLNGDGSFHVRFPSQGRHAEGDLSDQLLALIDGSQVQKIFPISSGKPSTPTTPTILGSYQVYLREPGYLSDGMYYSDFFIRGYAIHGYDPAPDYPASHGCMRLPITDAITAYDWLALGDWVDTYYT